jgi:hypothetical protein
MTYTWGWVSVDGITRQLFPETTCYCSGDRRTLTFTWPSYPRLLAVIEVYVSVLSSSPRLRALGLAKRSYDLSRFVRPKSASMGPKYLRWYCARHSASLKHLRVASHIPSSSALRKQVTIMLLLEQGQIRALAQACLGLYVPKNEMIGASYTA